MKKLIAIFAFSLIASTAFAATSVTQAVFSITSSAVTSTANLRVTPMDMRLPRDGNRDLMQTYVLTAGKTANYFLTKSTTVPLTDTLCVLIQADQDTLMRLNSETAFLKVYADQDVVRCFK